MRKVSEVEKFGHVGKELAAATNNPALHRQSLNQHNHKRPNPESFILNSEAPASPKMASFSYQYDLSGE